MNITEILFWILAAFTIFSALMVITSKNPVYSVLWLIVTFFTISGHYILMNAQFLAIVNIIVYAGAIMVLFLFVIMLMNLNGDVEPQTNRLVQLAGFLSASLQDLDDKATGIGLSGNLGKARFKEYVLSFEISSVRFLSA